MRRTIAGFTLLEVLMAILVVTLGLLGFAGTMRSVASLAGEGKARGRAALHLSSRLSQLRSELLASAPACLVPSAGMERFSDGIDQSWTASLVDGLVEVRIATSIPRAGRVVTDTLFSRMPCP